MKLLTLLLLIPMLLEGISAQYPRLYGGRMVKNQAPAPPKNYPQYQQLNDDVDDDDEDDADDDADDDDEGSIYPPDFAKLFPNPDGRPVGPDSYDSYTKHHPANAQAGRPTHGPAASLGPAASRGPVPQKRPPNNQAGGNHGGYYRPQQDRPSPSYDDAPPPRRQYNSGPPPQQYRDGPPPQQYRDGPPPQQYRDGPPPQQYEQGPPPQGGYNSGPPPQYRTEFNTVDEPESVEEPMGRQLYFVGNSRQVGPVKKPSVYKTNMYTRRNYQTYVPPRNYQTFVPARNYQTLAPTRRVYKTNRPTTSYAVVPSNVNVRPVPMTVRRPVVPRAPVSMRQAYGYGREVYPRTTPFSRYSIHSDYNPEYIINPTEMLSRRKFRYHASQRVPSQRIPVYSGYWPNPWVGHHYQKW